MTYGKSFLKISLGFCESELISNMIPNGFRFDTDNPEFLKDVSMTFTGLISITDPPRPGAAEAVQTCRAAGIKVVMVTGKIKSFKYIIN